jgi:hypothetical protein
MLEYYIEEYERSCSDRTEYGERLMARHAETLTLQGLSRCEFYWYQIFNMTYPRILESLPQEFFRISGSHRDILVRLVLRSGDQISEAMIP